MGTAFQKHEKRISLMVFSSTIFLFAFLPLTLAGYYLVDRRFKNIFLLLFSLFFYAWGEPKFVFVMICSILGNHVFALLMDRNLTRAEQLVQHSTAGAYRKRAKGWLCLMVVFNLSLFFVHKYLNFTIVNVNRVVRLFGMEPFTQTNIALPIGISFFTFQAMSYVFDVYRRKGQVQKNPLNTMLYIAMFPQLIAGPIVRYETVANEICNRKETPSDFAKGVKRFIIGLSKKAILANSIAIIADQAFGYTDFSQLSVLMAWLGAVAYTLQIFFDFSGYSDMAIGLGLMFGFHFSENFNYPYISKSVSEFWRRWHISLSTWFRDYVYIPLGGSRVNSKSRHIWNLFVVWLLTGLWHGAAWNFVAWGMLYFAVLVFEKMTKIPQRLQAAVARYIYRAITIFIVVIGWVIFRANGLKNALRYIGCMFGLMGNSGADALSLFLLNDSLITFLIAGVASTPALIYLKEKITKGHELFALNRLAYIGLFVLSIAYIINSAYDPFIYFNF